MHSAPPGSPLIKRPVQSWQRRELINFTLALIFVKSLKGNHFQIDVKPEL
ncbi:Ubiquitin receptor RAD23c, partial [Bienertia sinuspersici]